MKREEFRRTSRYLSDLAVSFANMAACITSPSPSEYVQLFIEGKDRKEPMSSGCSSMTRCAGLPWVVKNVPK
ncbi:MAG: hypothetical protein JXA22_02925 [Candidatus Thermoplasmatota archaeon]|nr:hypothetical protein [Candidatus Thermoplasmatota archaeon]